MYKYFPHTEDDLQAMLAKVGVKSLDDLYAQIPDSIRFKGSYELPRAECELEVRQLFERLGEENKQLTCFAGLVSTTIIRPLSSPVCCSVPSS